MQFFGFGERVDRGGSVGNENGRDRERGRQRGGQRGGILGRGEQRGGILGRGGYRGRGRNDLQQNRIRKQGIDSDSSDSS